MLFIKQSPISGKIHEMEVNCTPEEFAEWHFKHALIQDAMPNATADQREFLMTGITPDEWDEMFGEPVDKKPDDGYNALVRDFQQALSKQ
jgi:hypothetical protein